MGRVDIRTEDFKCIEDAGRELAVILHNASVTFLSNKLGDVENVYTEAVNVLCEAHATLIAHYANTVAKREKEGFLDFFITKIRQSLHDDIFESVDSEDEE